MRSVFIFIPCAKVDIRLRYNIREESLLPSSHGLNEDP
jgi:hypothetical protein